MFAVKNKLKAHIELFLDVKYPKNKTHMFFALMLDPRYLSMTSLLQLHQVENISSYTYLSNMAGMLLNYVVASEEKIKSSNRIFC